MGNPSNWIALPVLAVFGLAAFAYVVGQIIAACIEIRAWAAAALPGRAVTDDEQF